jgi:cobalt-zinc-cadmium efflux system outer membrane protein
MTRPGSGPKEAMLALAVAAALGPCGVGANEHAGPRAPTHRPHLLTLALAVQEGLAADPRIGADAETLRQAEADVRSASQLPNPSLSVSKTLVPFGSAFTPDLPGGPTQLDFEISYPLDWLVFGKRGAAVTSARAGLEQARAAHDDFVRQRRSEIAVAFVDVLVAARLLDLARQDASDLDRIQAIAQQRVAVGGAAAVEVDRSAVAVLEARRELRQRDAALRVARATLAATLGRTGEDADFEVEGDLDVGTPRGAPDLGALASTAEQARPDILARRRAVEKAVADLRLAQRSAWPALTARGAYDRQYQESLGFPDASSFGLGLDLALPLFDRNQGGVSQAASAQSQRELELRAALLALRAELVQAAAEYSVAREALLAEDRAQLETAERLRDRVQKAYELGGRPMLEVLDAQRVYREAARQDASGRAALLRAVHRLNAAVGQEVVP